MVVTLRNAGIGVGNNVSAVLSTSDAYVIITDGSQFYGTLAVGGSVPCQEDYDFVVASDCPDGHVLVLNLAITSNEGG